MLKRFKIIASAVALAVLAMPVVAQQLAVSRGVAQQPARTGVSLTPKYLFAFGHVLARTDKNGVTKFNYQNGRLASEVLPDGTVGTYRYDAGRFTGIVYTDGRYITLAYDANGALSGLTTNTGARVKFNVTSKLTPPRSFMTIQDGISALRSSTLNNVCRGTDNDSSCTIIIMANGGGDFGSGGGGGWGGGGGGGGSFTPPPDETPAQCQDRICDGAKRNMDAYCRIATNNPRSLRLCESKNMEYYGMCLRSCRTGDWSWMDDWNPIWE